MASSANTGHCMPSLLLRDFRPDGFVNVLKDPTTSKGILTQTAGVSVHQIEAIPAERPQAGHRFPASAEFRPASITPSYGSSWRAVLYCAIASFRRPSLASTLPSAK